MNFRFAAHILPCRTCNGTGTIHFEPDQWSPHGLNLSCPDADEPCPGCDECAHDCEQGPLRIDGIWLRCACGWEHKLAPDELAFVRELEAQRV